MDAVSESDWVPPPEVPIVESEVFHIPSGLPSLEEFVRTEIEKEAIDAVADHDAAIELQDVQYTPDLDGVDHSVEPAADDASVTDHPEADEGDAAMPLPEEDRSDDEFDLLEAEVKKPQKLAKKAAAELFEMDTVKIDFGDIKQKIEDQSKEELRLRLVASTHDYIENLIAKVVEMCEYEDPDEILRARLCKTKVLRDLEAKMFQLDVEQKVRFFLNRKTVEYFRRKKASRPLLDDSPENIVNELRKYREALMMVNKNRNREEHLKTYFDGKRAKLRQQVQELEKKSKEKGRDFVLLAKRVFAPDSSERMEALVEALTNKIRHMQDEISKVRFVLIQRQHTMAHLQGRAKKLEDLGNGLRMVDFEHLQTENQALGKKIEDRNNELNRLHTRCNADIHTLAHIREKQHMLRNTITAQQDAYDELIEEKQLCREYLNTQKIARGAIRKESKQISFQGGLLDKPDLLLDYDVTVKKAEVLRRKIAEMKATQIILDNKLKHMMRSLI